MTRSKPTVAAQSGDMRSQVFNSDIVPRDEVELAFILHGIGLELWQVLGYGIGPLDLRVFQSREGCEDLGNASSAVYGVDIDLCNTAIICDGRGVVPIEEGRIFVYGLDANGDCSVVQDGGEVDEAFLDFEDGFLYYCRMAWCFGGG